MAREKIPPPPEPSESEIESQDLSLASASLEEQARTVLAPIMLRRVKKIAYYTAKVGLPLEEACLLVDIDYAKLKEEMKLEPIIEKIIRIKELEYKKDLLYTLSQKARQGDDKLAQWLLAKKFPEEYGEKSRSSTDNGDVLFEAIRFIRKSGDMSPMVNEANARPIAVLPASPQAGKPIAVRIEDILSQPHGDKPTQHGS